MTHLREILTNTRPNATLDIAALDLAAIEFRGLDGRPFLEILDSHAVELAERIGDDTDGEEFVQATNEYLFEDLGFEGNQSNYYDPRNSCLNHVLVERTGIPISLAVLYMELARRLAKPVYGIALPAHFIVKYDDGDYSAFIDVFNGGRILEPFECLEMARSVVGDTAESYLEPVAPRQIAIRMLNNLRAIYLEGRSYEKCVDVLNMLIAAEPGPQELLQRGILNVEIRQFRAGMDDLERYLRLAPAAPNRGDVEKQITILRQWLAKLH